MLFYKSLLLLKNSRTFFQRYKQVVGTSIYERYFFYYETRDMTTFLGGFFREEICNISTCFAPLFNIC